MLVNTSSINCAFSIAAGTICPPCHAPDLIRASLDYEQFKGNSVLVEACVFNLSQMGELANKVDDSFAAEHPDIPWRTLYGLRNRIVHDYEGVNLQLIWEIIHDDLPRLRDILNRI